MNTGSASSMARSGGCLVLVVGPSGAGKDTLIRGAMSELAGNRLFAFPRRVITRETGEDEENEFAGPEAFEEMRSAGWFALSWAAHGHSYGIRSSIVPLLEGGVTVVANVSRTVLEEALRGFPVSRAIHVTARADVLRERLLLRGRESVADVEERIRRSAALPLPARVRADTIDNSGTIEQGTAAFVRLLWGYAAESRQRDRTLKRASAVD